MLSSDGTLSYALTPEKEARGAMKVAQSSISTDKQQGLIHVDSGSTVFHFKMLQPADFQEWTTQLRRFLGPQSDLGGAGGGSDASRGVRALDHANDLVEQAITALKTHEKETGGNVSGLVNALMEVQRDHAVVHETLSRRANSPGGAVGGAGVAAGGANSDAISVHSTMDDADFYDAKDYDGVEYEIGGGGAVRGNDGDDDRDDTGVDDDEDSSDEQPAEQNERQSQTSYRRKLPAPVSGDEVSLFSMLKKNVGKDLSTISFPVSFNCPLSLLQASAEEFEYAPDLLERAAQSENPVDRICLVGAFAVSGYASTAHRSSRKPFNPLLGETFECVRTDRRLRFVAEKVVHRPPIVAVYAEGKNWSVEGWSTVKNKFWGKSLELIPEGDIFVKLQDGDTYSIQKPSSFMRNLLAGNKYLEHVGDLVVTNVRTQEKLVMNFKESSMFGGAASRNHLQGTVQDANGSSLASIKGKWDEQVVQAMDKNHYQVLWEAEPFPSNPETYYGFTYFAISLNEITDDIKGVIPPTDSRLRPDQRAFENGNVDEAEQVKHELEGQQRERRKELEASGAEYKPVWFHKNTGGDGPEWVYGGPDGEKYFQERNKVEKGDSRWPGKVAEIFKIEGK